MLFGLSYLKIGAGLAALAILVGIFLFLKHDVYLRQWQKDIVATTKVASGNPKLDAGTTGQQITLMGTAITNLKGSIEVQNKAVAKLGEDRQTALAKADREAVLRKEVIEQSESLARQLRDGSLSPVAKEKLEEELRRVQDLAWEAGL
jgi:hypothetical protein